MMFEEMQDYYWIMAARHRLILFDEGQRGSCTFFVLQSDQELHDFYARSCWSTPPDSVDGTIIYIDKLIARGLTRGCVREIERVITEQCPSWEHAVWYRPGRDVDRRYTYTRRHHASYQT